MRFNFSFVWNENRWRSTGWNGMFSMIQFLWSLVEVDSELWSSSSRRAHTQCVQWAGGLFSTSFHTQCSARVQMKWRLVPQEVVLGSWGVIEGSPEVIRERDWREARCAADDFLTGGGCSFTESSSSCCQKLFNTAAARSTRIFGSTLEHFVSHFQPSNRVDSRISDQRWSTIDSVAVHRKAEICQEKRGERTKMCKSRSRKWPRMLCS